MRKIIEKSQIFIKFSVFALLFLVTAAPTAVEYGLAPNTKELGKSKINELWSPTPSCGKSGCEGENIYPNTNNIGQAERNASDGIASPAESLRQAQRNTHDGVTAPANQGSLVHKPHVSEGMQQEGMLTDPDLDGWPEIADGKEVLPSEGQGLVLPADGQDPGTKTPTYSNAAVNHKLDKGISGNLGIDTSPPVAYQGGPSGNPLDLVGPISNEDKP